MRVRHRNGELEPVDVTRIVVAVARCAGDDLLEVDPLRVATRTISGLYDGATTAELASTEGPPGWTGRGCGRRCAPPSASWTG